MLIRIQNSAWSLSHQGEVNTKVSSSVHAAVLKFPFNSEAAHEDCAHAGVIIWDHRPAVCKNSAKNTSESLSESTLKTVIVTVWTAANHLVQIND